MLMFSTSNWWNMCNVDQLWAVNLTYCREEIQYMKKNPLKMTKRVYSADVSSACAGDNFAHDQFLAQTAKILLPHKYGSGNLWCAACWFRVFCPLLSPPSTPNYLISPSDNTSRLSSSRIFLLVHYLATRPGTSCTWPPLLQPPAGSRGKATITGR